jgi:RNA polymerase sigma-70 factor (ECF subfamily)
MLLDQCREDLDRLAQFLLPTRLRAKLDPADLVQQALLKAHEKRHQFRGHSPGEFMAWLRIILAHELAAARRKFATAARDLCRERCFGESSPLLRTRLGDRNSPCHCAIREEQKGHLAEALARLCSEQRRAVELRYLQGLSLAEVGLRMGRSQEAVVGLLYRGLKSLRRLLAAPRGEEPAEKRCPARRYSLANASSILMDCRPGEASDPRRGVTEMDALPGS